MHLIKCYSIPSGSRHCCLTITMKAGFQPAVTDKANVIFKIAVQTFPCLNARGSPLIPPIQQSTNWLFFIIIIKNDRSNTYFQDLKKYQKNRSDLNFINNECECNASWENERFRLLSRVLSRKTPNWHDEPPRHHLATDFDTILRNFKGNTHIFSDCQTHLKKENRSCWMNHSPIYAEINDYR